jgi:Restriction endonuclease S subunits
MVWNDELKREIPKGWVVKKLSEVCSRVQSGGTPATKNTSFYDGNIKWFSTKELDDSFVLDSEKHISQEALDNSSAKLFSKDSVLIAIYASPTAGRLGILSEEGAINQAISGIEPKGDFSTEYIFMTLLTTRQRLLALASGTSQQNVSNQIIRDYRVVVPSDKILRDFNNCAKPLFVQLKMGQQESRQLVKLRDWLLPMLMNGQVSVN